jgi:RNA polymerase sigma-70 factor (ECF subfamily)
MSINLSAEDVPSDLSVTEGTLGMFLQTAEKRRSQLLRLAQRVTKCSEDAEDLVQEAFLKAYKGLPSFRGESQMSTWLTAIVRNAACEYLRNRKGRVFVSIDVGKEDRETAPLDFPDPGKNPEETLEHEEMADILRDELKNLSFVCRRTIELCVLEEYSQREAANTLNLTVSTVKSSVFRGRRILNRRLSRHACREQTQANPHGQRED